MSMFLLVTGKDEQPAFVNTDMIAVVRLAGYRLTAAGKKQPAWTLHFAGSDEKVTIYADTDALKACLKAPSLVSDAFRSWPVMLNTP